MDEQTEGFTREAIELMTRMNALALVMAIQARAENLVLRRILAEEGIEIESAAFNAECEMRETEISDNMLEDHPWLEGSMPSTLDQIRDGFLSLER